MNISGCYQINEKGLWWFLKFATNLESLNLKDNDRITGKCFRMLSKNIKALNLINCNKV